MRAVETEDDLDRLDGEIESATLEIKGFRGGQLKKTEKLVETIQGMMNGAEEGGHIILGLEENDRQEVDLSRKCPVLFPTKIRDMNFEPANFAEYRDHLMKMLRDSTENYLEGLCRVGRIKARAGAGEFIVITVKQSLFRPHRNTNGHFYIRRTEGRTDRMTTAEVESAILEKEVKLQALHSGTAPKKNEPVGPAQYEHPFRDDRPIAELIPFGHRERSREIRLMSGAEEFLWLIPSVQLSPPPTAQELKEAVHSEPMLVPFGRVTGFWHERNEYGAVVFQESAVEPGTALNMTQLFSDGRLLGVDRFMLNAEKLREFSGTELPYIPSSAFEEDFIAGLANFRRFLGQNLKSPYPYRFRAGLSGVKGYAVAVPFNFGGKFAGNLIANEVFYNGEISSPEQDDEQLLIPFFEKVWLEAGLRRPNKVRSR